MRLAGIRNGFLGGDLRFAHIPSTDHAQDYAPQSRSATRLVKEEQKIDCPIRMLVELLRAVRSN
jgi:hypothetical protein